MVTQRSQRLVFHDFFLNRNPSPLFRKTTGSNNSNTLIKNNLRAAFYLKKKKNTRVMGIKVAQTFPNLVHKLVLMNHCL